MSTPPMTAVAVEVMLVTSVLPTHGQGGHRPGRADKTVKGSGQGPMRSRQPGSAPPEQRADDRPTDRKQGHQIGSVKNQVRPAASATTPSSLSRILHGRRAASRARPSHGSARYRRD